MYEWHLTHQEVFLRFTGGPGDVFVIASVFRASASPSVAADEEKGDLEGTRTLGSNESARPARLLLAITFY